MDLPPIVDNIFKCAPQVPGTVYHYSVKFCWSIACKIAGNIWRIFVEPLSRFINGVFFVPVRIILRNLFEFALLPVNMPLYILFGTNLSNLLLTFDTNAGLFALVMFSQYVISTFIFGVSLGVISGVLLSAFHKSMPIPNYYYEPSIRRSFGYIKDVIWKVVFKLIGIELESPEISPEPNSFNVPVYEHPIVQTQQKLTDPEQVVSVKESSTFKDAQEYPYTESSSSSSSNANSDLNIHATSISDLGASSQGIDLGNMTPMSMPDTNGEEDYDIDETSEITRLWDSDNSYAADTARTEGVDDISQLVYRNRIKKAIDNIDLRNL